MTSSCVPRALRPLFPTRLFVTALTLVACTPPDVQDADADLELDGGRSDSAVPTPDGGPPPDAGKCPAGQTRCGTACVDPQTDEAHCGACDAACTALPGVAAAICEAGACEITSCATDFADCDEDSTNGCEVRLSNDPAHCGTCDAGCGGSEACILGSCSAPRLLAVTPSIAEAGQSVTLEGDFPSGTVSVRFPGTVTPTVATRLGPDRLSVTVPTAATAGELALMGGAAPVSFRRTTHAMGLHRFRGEYEQTGYARRWPTLDTARVAPLAITTDRWLYVIGGWNGGSSGIASVERALLNADGSLGPFTAAGALPTPRIGATGVRVGDRVFVIGGERLSSVDEAAIDPSTGTLGAFVAASATLTAPRHDHRAVLVGSSVYVVGGTSRSVERARVRADGSLESFRSIEGVQTGVVRRRPAIAVIEGWLYVFGGSTDGTTPLSSVERAPIRADGSLGPFQAAGTMRRARDGAQAVVLGRADEGVQVFLLGGAAGGPGSVERAVVNVTSGDVTFSDHEAPLRIERREHAAVVVGNHLYVVGGRGSSGALASLERASIARTATLALAGSFPDGGVAPDGWFAHGEYVYFPAREARPNLSSPLWRAQVGPDGVLGPPSATGGALPESSRGYLVGTFAVTGRYVYQLGGIAWRNDLPGEGGLPLARVLRAPLNDDGTVGAFESVGSLPSANYLHSLAVIGNRLYVLGGCISTCTARTTVWSATLDRDGLAGPIVDAGVALSTGRYQALPVVLEGHLWLVGGLAAGVAVGDADRADIGVDGTLSGFTRVALDFDSDPNPALRAAVIADRLVRLQPDEAALIDPSDEIGPFVPLTLSTPGYTTFFETRGGLNVWVGSGGNVRYELR